ncbi:MAG: Holliday junction resolvase RuvX [Synergistaceae bacterium]|nr:Holliday junction resolvase RuvX [Synergistaceae bacterium]
MGRLIGLDLGTVRIGVAITDPLGLFAQGIAVWRVDSAWLESLKRLIAESAPVDLVVVGLPLRTTGAEGPEAARIRSMAETIAAEIDPIPVEFIDERFSTTRAHQILLEGNVDARKRRTRVDKVAAAVFLQDFLDRRRDGNG